jgi:hypothetical protein
MKENKANSNRVKNILFKGCFKGQTIFLLKEYSPKKLKLQGQKDPMQKIPRVLL